MWTQLVLIWALSFCWDSENDCVVSERLKHYKNDSVVEQSSRDNEDKSFLEKRTEQKKTESGSNGHNCKVTSIVFWRN